MLRTIREKRAQSIFEYIGLISILLLTLFVFQKYVLRGIDGRWKSVGDSFGHGRQYDPKTTVSCKFDYVYTNKWYDEDCYDRCIAPLTKNPDTRQSCRNSCNNPICDESF